MKKKKYSVKRKKLNLHVKRELQFWILERFLIVLFISILLGLSVLYFFSHKEIGTSFHRAHLTIRHVSDLLLPVIVASGGFCLLLGFFCAIFFPQRVAGPIYRIERGLLEIAKGDFTHVFRLRKGDRFQTLADAANQAVDRVRQELREVEEGLGEAEEAMKKGDPQRAMERISELRRHLRTLGC